MTKFNQIIAIIIMTVTPLFAEPLTKTDINNLQKRPIKEHILYETYLETSKGLASYLGINLTPILQIPKRSF